MKHLLLTTNRSLDVGGVCRNTAAKVGGTGQYWIHQPRTKGKRVDDPRFTMLWATRK